MCSNKKCMSTMMWIALGVFLATFCLQAEPKEYKIGWLMVGDWDSDYPNAPFCLSTHVDKPSDWTITYEPIWFDQIPVGQCIVADYDMIVTTGHQHYTFTEDQKKILEEYVKSGGILWFDDCANIEIDNMPFGYEINFGEEQYNYWGYAYNSPANHDFTINLPEHPLMKGIFTIDPDHIRDDRDSTRWFTPFYQWDNHFEVVMSGRDQTWGYQGPAILAAQVGYGKIVASAMDVTCAMEGAVYGGFPATRFDFHLVFNILNWSSQPVPKNYTITWTKPSEGAEFPQGQLIPFEFTVVDEYGNPVNDNTAFLELYKDNVLISNQFTITCTNGVYQSSWNSETQPLGEYTIIADFEGYCSQEPVDFVLKEAYTLPYTLTLRVAGRKYNTVQLNLLENGQVFDQATVVRLPGSPNEQMVTIDGMLNPNKTYTAQVIYTQEDPPKVGGNPVWVTIQLGEQAPVVLHHIFNGSKTDTWETPLNF